MFLKSFVQFCGKYSLHSPFLGKLSRLKPSRLPKIVFFADKFSRFTDYLLSKVSHNSQFCPLLLLFTSSTNGNPPVSRFKIEIYGGFATFKIIISGSHHKKQGIVQIFSWKYLFAYNYMQVSKYGLFAYRLPFKRGFPVCQCLLSYLEIVLDHLILKKQIMQ